MDLKLLSVADAPCASAALGESSEGAISFEELQGSLEATPWSRDGIEVLLADEERIRLAIDGGERDSRWVLLYSEVLEKLWLLQMTFLSRGEESRHLKERIEERRGVLSQALSSWQRAFDGGERLSLRKVVTQLEKFEIAFPQKIITIFANLRENASNDILREYFLCDLYKELQDYQRCIKHCQICLSLLPVEANHVFLSLKGTVHTNLGIAHSRLGNYREALEDHQKSLQIAEELGERGDVERAYGNLGIAHRNLGSYREALQYHQRHLQVAEELGDRGSVGIACGNMGNAHQALRNYREALENHRKSLQIAEELGDRGGVGKAYGKVGVVHSRLGNYQEALQHHQKALQIAEELGDKGGVGMAYGNIGIAHQALSNYREALQYHQKDLQIAEELGDRDGVGKAYKNIGNVHQALSNYRKLCTITRRL